MRIILLVISLAFTLVISLAYTAVSPLSAEPPPFPKAPEFSSDAVWIDTVEKASHSVAGYRGRVLLVDFWEYTCINCIRDFATLKRLYAKYHPYGFDIVGVHYGEFPMGFSVENVREAAARFQLPWPVVADLHGSIWNAYHAEAWPSAYLMDQNGDIVFHEQGEILDTRLERAIRILLRDTHPEVNNILLDSAQDISAADCGGEPTPEMYIGDFQGTGRGALQNSQGYHDGSITNFRSDHAPADGRVMLSGKWRTEIDGVVSADRDDAAELRYHARSVYAVLSVKNSKKPVRLYIEQDGKALPRDQAGVDVRFDPRGSYVEVAAPRMYYFVRNIAFGSHLLTLKPEDKDLTLHSVTYGNNCQQNFEQV